MSIVYNYSESRFQETITHSHVEAINSHDPDSQSPRLWRLHMWHLVSHGVQFYTKARNPKPYD